MKYVFTFFALSACGVWAANAGISANKHAAGEKNFMEEKTGDEKMARRNRDGHSNSYNQPTYIDSLSPESDAALPESPIPALILPNNVCVINTDLSPERTIEEHIAACIVAHRMRQSLIP